MIDLIAYLGQSSVAPGGSVDVKVSCTFPHYEADLVEVLSADPNPASVGIRYQPVAEVALRQLTGRVQPVDLGSYMWAKPAAADRVQGAWTFSVRVQPWLLDAQPQCIVSVDGAPGFQMAVSAQATWVQIAGAVLTLPPLEVKDWYELRVVCERGRVRLQCVSLASGTFQETEGPLDVAMPFTFASYCLAAQAVDERGVTRFLQCFNGRLEDPALVSDTFGQHQALDIEQLDADTLVHWWDFSREIGSGNAIDRGRHASDGQVVNLPARGVCGSRWVGTDPNYRHAPREYAAIHFHEDDLYDANWGTDFALTIPPGLRSGIYGIRLRAGDAEDVVPLFVLPAADGVPKPLALLVSTMTYLAYANYDRSNFDEAYRARRKAWGAAPHHPGDHKEFGLSTYDVHRDGSGVMYSSARRPILNNRFGYLAYVDLNGSGLRHLSADMHLVCWLRLSGIEFDLITDHEMHAQGVDVLQRYRGVVTCTHPEYHTPTMLDALADYVRQGGRLVYLGGNGFYWKVGVSTAFPDAIEVRRAEGGTRTWECESGEYYHSLDGEYGGLWRRNRRPPQALVGVGMSAQGSFEGTYYRRTPESYGAAMRWMFDGIADDKIGDFGYSGGGAAGFELDRADHELGTPRNAVVVAVSENVPSHHSVTPEEVLTTLPTIGNRSGPALIRADMTYFDNPAGGEVFSVGSITFCGSLLTHGGNNNVSTLLRNVLHRFQRAGA